MKQSQLFSKTRKEAPKDEVSKNAQLLIQAGYIHKEMAGVYTLLPLGFRVINKINGIIRDEMNAIGGQEMQMTALQNPDTWKTTHRFGLDVAFSTQLKGGSSLELGWTHEEAITQIMKQHLSSYKDLPMYAYQIQTKFRNEERAKSGIMRGREFLMKDLYSFSRNQADLDAFYEQAAQAYKNIFTRVGIGKVTYMTFASGGDFSKYSHEFQTVCGAGEDIIYVSDTKNIAINSEVLTEEVLADLALKREELREEKSIEVGNIFKLGTRFSDALGLRYVDESGTSLPIVMGSYGIGPGRLMGTIVEILSDNKGIVWPESIAPFRVHLLSLSQDEEAQKIYTLLTDAGVEVLYDDRDMTAGAKFADSDLMGIPFRVVVGKKSLEQGGVELKRRTEEQGTIVSIDTLLASLQK